MACISWHERTLLARYRIATSRPTRGAVAEGLERWTGDRLVQGSNPAAATYSLRDFDNSLYSALPVSFGGDTM